MHFKFSVERLTILLNFPRLSSCTWCLKLYSVVCGGCGVLFSILWVVGHIYVLTQPQGAKVVISFLCPSELDSYSRYADILLGLSLLLSHLVLCYGSVQEMKAALSLFFILSLSLLVLYWVWFSYLKYGKG